MLPESRTKTLASVALVAAAIIHLLPTIGVLGPDRLASLYGVAVSEPNLEILLRHRALLFGIIGALLLAAAFRPTLQPTAIAIGLASVTSFLGVAWVVGGINAQLHRVVVADVVALVLLIGAWTVPRAGSRSA